MSKKKELKCRVKLHAKGAKDAYEDGMPGAYTPVRAHLRGQQEAYEQVLRWIDKIWTDPAELKVGDTVKILVGPCSGVIRTVDEVVPLTHRHFPYRVGHTMYKRDELEKL